MTDTTLEERTAKLEGALEQIDKRLSNVEVIVQDMRNEMHELYRDLDRKIDTKITELDQKFTNKIDTLDQKFTGKIDALDHKIDTNLKWIVGLMIPILIGVIMSIVFG